MSTNTKKTRREILEIEARINELDRAQAYLSRDYYKERKTQLLEHKEDIQEKLDKREIAPDIQYIISENQLDEVENVDFPVVSVYG